MRVAYKVTFINGFSKKTVRIDIMPKQQKASISHISRGPVTVSPLLHSACFILGDLHQQNQIYF